jgi:hypothetical protein
MIVFDKLRKRKSVGSYNSDNWHAWILDRAAQLVREGTANANIAMSQAMFEYSARMNTCMNCGKPREEHVRTQGWKCFYGPGEWKKRTDIND